MKLVAITSAALLAVGLGTATFSTSANAFPALAGAATPLVNDGTSAEELVQPANYYGYGYYPRRRHFHHYGFYRPWRPYYSYYAPRRHYGYYGY